MNAILATMNGHSNQDPSRNNDMSALARRATETSHEDDNSNGSAPPDDVDDGLGVVEATGGDGCMGGKKAIHVKWAGKTIALGTFPIAEADEKCARAKALTRAWRSTMRPKPTREWVMLELERLQVRVVSGRLGRKGGSGEADDDEDGDGEKKQTTKKKKKEASLSGNKKPKMDQIFTSRDDDDDFNEAQDILQRGSSVTRPSEGMVGSSMPGMDMIRSNMSCGPDENIMQKSDGNKVSGLGSDSFRNLAGQRNKAISENELLSGGFNSGSNNMSLGSTGLSGMPSALGGSNSLTSGSGLLGAGSGGNQLGLSVNPNQHYEMLKRHHMNLLNEIQETTLMMNLYQQQLQQQQLQQQQLQQDNQGMSTSAAEQQLAMQLAQQQQASSSQLFDSLYGMGGAGPVPSSQQFPGLHSQTGLKQGQQQMGLGIGSSGSGTSNQMQLQALLRQQNLLSGGTLSDGMLPGMQQRRLSFQQQQQFLGNDDDQEATTQARLQKLKQDIAERQRRENDRFISQDSIGQKRSKGN